MDGFVQILALPQKSFIARRICSRRIPTAVVYDLCDVAISGSSDLPPTILESGAERVSLPDYTICSDKTAACLLRWDSTANL